MTEGKAPLTNRLRREGRWDEAAAWKDAEIKRLRAEGMLRKDAQEAAWEALALEYPPLAEQNSELPGASEELLEGDPDEGLDETTPGYFPSDAQWVYSSMVVRGIKPDNAPSSGAWALLRWARKNPQRFFENVLPKAIAAQPAPSAPSSQRVEDPGLEELERLLAQYN